MRQRIIVLVTLMAFFTNINGCGGMKNIRLFGDEIQQHETTIVHTVQLNSTVKRVILKIGEVILVNDKGVHLDTLANKLVATDVNDEAIVISFNDIEAVQSANNDIIVFDERRGHIDIPSQTIIGTQSDSTEIRIPLSDVCYVSGMGYKEMDTTTKIIFGVLGVALLVLFASDGRRPGVKW